jgi:hypothetical protein
LERGSDGALYWTDNNTNRLPVLLNGSTSGILSLRPYGPGGSANSLNIYANGMTTFIGSNGVSGSISNGIFIGNGSGLTNLTITGNEVASLNASALSSGVIPNSVLPGFQPPYATVGGGLANQATNFYATVAGGANNLAGGQYSFAAGQQAQALHQGAFVWADSQSNPFASTAPDQFSARATGGVRFVTGVDTGGNPAAGVQLAAGGTAWATVSDQNAKKNFASVSGQKILAQLAAVPVEKWNYKWEADTNTPHIGPMAQAFKAAFYPGRDDKSITTLEFDGVELAAIQGLNEKLEARTGQLEAENAELKQRLAELEARVKQLAREP